MKFVRFLFAWAVLTLVARATTLVAPSFDELVQGSEMIFRGRVTAVKSDWAGEGKERRIATWVTFVVERTLRGAAVEEITLEFLGGEAGTKRLVLAGWPKFAVGERGVFFVENRTGQVCPLMRLRHGKYRIAAEDGAAGGVERVVRDDGAPLRATVGVSAPLADATGPARAAAGEGLTLGEFEAQIATRSAALPRTEAVVR